MTLTESSYAQIEKKALAFTWANVCLSDYLVGLKFHFQVNHKLVPLFSMKNLDELPFENGKSHPNSKNLAIHYHIRSRV